MCDYEFKQGKNINETNCPIQKCTDVFCKNHQPKKHMCNHKFKQGK